MWKTNLRPEAIDVINYCKQQGIRTILLSGDTKAKCEVIAQKLSLDEVLAEQTPAQKLQQVERLCALAPTVMVGDGINDAPALAKATISISLSQASQLAIQSASVVLPMADCNVCRRLCCWVKTPITR